jgi:O-antigen ligase
VQLGAVAVVLAAFPYKPFDLDRYFVAKDLVLHVTALVAALAIVVSRRRLSLNGLDVLLAVFLVLSFASALFATNWWLAGRALAISLSGVALFWVARSLRGEGHERALVGALAAAAALGAVTSLMQAYGVETEYFSLNRAPGGTFGNRNFMAHVAAIGSPALVYWTLTTRSRVGYLVGALGFGAVMAAQVLSRSRAAWLALAAAFGVMAVAGWLTRSRWRDPRLVRRAVALGVATAIGVAAAIALPNALNWKSDSPYLDSMRGVVNYKQGSGRGRLVQYTNSVRMTLAHPILGVGPGNWAVIYPRYASDNDPSLDSEGMTANPWPSSDWAAFLSERGFITFVALALALLALCVAAIRQLKHARSTDQAFAALALGGTIAATLVAGAFDAVLLLAAPSLLVWALLGALSEPRGRGPTLSRGVHQWGPALVFALGVLAVGRSALQTAAMAIFSNTSRTSALEQASFLDPGNYRIHLRLANAYYSRGNCDRTKSHARAARELFPNAAPPRELLADCGERVRRRT